MAGCVRASAGYTAVGLSVSRVSVAGCVRASAGYPAVGLSVSGVSGLVVYVRLLARLLLG